MAYVGTHAVDGSMNVTVVTGGTLTGLYAVDGSINVVKSTGSNYLGAYHPCGALWETASPTGFLPLRAPNGSMYCSVTPFTRGGTKVTVISGSL
jgi:hypothetical protein